MALNNVDYIMVMVSNMARSVEFYKDRLGIPMKFGSPDWTEFQTGATTLALHGGGKTPDGPREQISPVAGTCSIGFNVENLDQTYELLRARGVVFTTPPTAREGSGVKLAIAVDPDGLAISFGETAKKK